MADHGDRDGADDWDLDGVADGLLGAREDWRNQHHRHAEYGHGGFPSRQALEAISVDLSGALFPLRLGPSSVRVETENAYVVETLQRALTALREQIRLELGYDRGGQGADADAAARRMAAAFARRLPDIRRLLDTDVEAAYAGDPAARSVDEMLICYPCIRAVIHHRLAHSLYRLGAPLIARIVAEVAHSLTGIDIHPGARIGRRFFIDHGTGIVIGETAILGDRVRLYQGGTLGGTPLGTGAARSTNGSAERRHPTIGDDAVIFAGAVLLGPITIGARSTIAGNIWLRSDVPPDSIVEAAAPAIRSAPANG